MAIKKNEALMCATTWTDHENIMLSERSQTQKATNYVSIYEMSGIGKSTETERLEVARGSE